jgi:hypothetical protein
VSPHPIALTQAQLEIVIDQAQFLPVLWRSRFLDAVADQLLPLATITDDAVQQACARVLARIGVAA